MRSNILNAVALLNSGAKSGVVSSNLKYTLSSFYFLSILQKHGFIKHLRCFKRDSRSLIQVFFTYIHSQSLLFGLHAGSRPSRRFFIRFRDLVSCSNFHCVLILHTSLGILTHNEAFILGLGGEVICFLYL